MKTALIAIIFAIPKKAIDGPDVQNARRFKAGLGAFWSLSERSVTFLRPYKSWVTRRNAMQSKKFVRNS